MKKMYRLLLITALFLTEFHFLGSSTSISAEENENLALNKTVEVSGVEGGTNADGSYVYPQFDPKGITDGDTSSRWSSDHTLLSSEESESENQSAWAIIDLGEKKDFNSVNIYWESSNSRFYELQASNDKINWETLKTYKNLNLESKNYKESYFSDTEQSYQFIRVYAKLGNKDAYKTISIYEIEVFNQQASGIDVALAEVRDKIPTISADQKSIILPQPTNTKYKTKLYASSNEAVIDLNGYITYPVSNMNVNLFYEVYSDDEKVQIELPVVMPITSPNTIIDNANAKPNVLPSLREWWGDTGTFTFTGNIVIENENMRATAEMVQFYFDEMLNQKPEILVGQPSAGDIYFKRNDALTVGEEGYTIDIKDIVVAEFSHDKGMLYAGTTLTQIMSQSETLNTVPKGITRDYPQYEVRSILLDVARLYMPLDYLAEVSKYAAYFKLNELHLHINDNGGETAYSFRIESLKYPELNKGVTTYSQEDYRNYQKEVKKYGIEVVTEIDTPGHSGAIMNIRPDLMLSDGYHLDLTNPESIEFVKSIIDEFLDGDDPIFQGSKFHIGADEYDRTYSEEVRAYMDGLINYVNGKGLETRMWASLGKGGFEGNTPVSTNAVVHFWADHDADFNEMKNDGYKFINTDGGRIYIVPGHFNDYLNIPYLYETWEVSQYRGGYYLAAGHPQNLGAEGAVWNDIKVGSSEFDVFDRSKDQMILMAEKAWSGEKDPQRSGADFINDYNKLPKYSPGANPFRNISTNSETILSYDFEEVDGNTLKDASGNSKDATLKDIKIDNNDNNHYAKLNGQGYLSLPEDSLGYPYTVTFDLKIDKKTGKDAVILQSKDGTLYYNYDDTKKLVYERKGYTYLLNADIPLDEWFTVTLQGTNATTKLFINGKEAAEGEYYKTDAVKKTSSSFILPLQKVGQGIIGGIDNIAVYKNIHDPMELYQPGSNINSGNLLLSKPVEVSSVEGGKNTDGSYVYPQFDPKHLVDGNLTSRNSFSPNDDAWIIVDMGEEQVIHTLTLNFNEKPISYELLYSLDGTTWESIDKREGLTAQEKGTETHSLNSMIVARYIKYQEIEGFPYPGYDHLSGNLNEIEAYGVAKDRVDTIVGDAEFIIKQEEKYSKKDSLSSNLKKNIDEVKNADYTTYSYDDFCDLIVDTVRNTKLYEKGLLLEMITEWESLDQAKLTSDQLSQLNQNIETARGLMKFIGIDRETWENGFYDIKIKDDGENPVDPTDPTDPVDPNNPIDPGKEIPSDKEPIKGSDISTGDTTNIPLLVFLLGVGTLGIVILIKRKKSE